MSEIVPASEWAVLNAMAGGSMPKNARITDRPGALRPVGCKKNCRRHTGIDISWTGMVGTDWKLPWPWRGRVKAICRGEPLKPGGKSRNRYITIEVEGMYCALGCGLEIKLYHVDIPPGLVVDQIVEPATVLGTTTSTLDPNSTGVHLHIEVWYPVGWQAYDLVGFCAAWTADTLMAPVWDRMLESISPPLQRNLQSNLMASSPECGSSSAASCGPPCLPDPPDPSPPARRDPLILNLNGNGIETLGLDREIQFDFDGDGFRELTGWVAPGNAFLILDVNGNDIPDNGSEFFGDFTILPSGMLAVNGFDALALYDANADGRIDTNDPIWPHLKLWECDPGGVEIADPQLDGRMSTLDEAGIRAINLESTITNREDQAGNTEVRTGHFEWTDDRIGTIAQYSLQRDTRYTLPVEYLDVPLAISELPEIYGYGNVHDLHQAMVRDSSGQLKSLVEAFAAEQSIAVRATILDQIVYKWTGADSVEPNARGPFMDARRIVALEQFYGTSLGVLNANLARGWQNIYSEIVEYFYSALTVQTHLNWLYDKITYTWDDTAQHYATDMSGVIGELQNQLTINPEEGRQLLSEFARTMRGLGNDRLHCLACRELFIDQDPSLAWIIDTGGLDVYDQLGQGDGWYFPHMFGTWGSEVVKGSPTEGDGYINSLSGNDVVYGTDRNEFLYNQDGDALFVAGGGNDRIWAGDGADIIDGGEGNDTLYGEAGNDTYIFRRGSGNDTIIDIDTTEGNIDTIWLGSSLTLDDVNIRRVGANLVVGILDTSDTITVKDFFRNNSTLNHVEQIQFMDGTVLMLEDMIGQAYAPTEGDDIIFGTSEADDLSGLGGRDMVFGEAGSDTLHGDADGDWLYGGAGDDLLEGGAAEDRLFGDEGVDILDGGTENDYLAGGTGNDTYLFSRGAGQDIIDDTDTTAGNADILELAAGILPTDVELHRSGNDLIVTITDTGDSVTIRDWLDDDIPVRGVELITFDDGTIWETEDIQGMLLTGTEADDTIIGFSDRADTIEGFGGSDTLKGRGGDDTLNAGAGDDSVVGGDGSDTLTEADGKGELLAARSAITNMGQQHHKPLMNHSVY